VSDPLDWDALKLCKPRLSPNIQYESRNVRGERWLIVRNSVSGEHLRLNAAAANLLALIDGDTSIEALCEASEQHSLSSDQIGATLAPLCASGLLSLGAEHEQERLLVQHQKNKLLDRRGRFSNPLAIKIALHNPDSWLGGLVVNVSWLFSRWTLVFILSFVGSGIVTPTLADIFIDVPGLESNTRTSPCGGH